MRLTSPYVWPRWVYLVVGLCGGAAGTALSLLVATRPAESRRDPPPVAVTCRGVLAEPGFYAGRRVRLSTAGMEPGERPGELVYRRWVSLPPAVVCRFDAPVPVPVPAWVVGLCGVPGEGPVLVTGCRPD